jgi:serine/threonine protein kinase
MSDSESPGFEELALTPCPRETTRRCAVGPAGSAEPSVAAGQRLGRFRVLSVVGEGATARVYRARDPLGGPDVALKVLRKELLSVEEYAARFWMEGELLSLLEHPGVLPLLDRGVTLEGLPWYATPWSSRGSVADQMLRRGLLPRAQLLEIGAEVLDVLHYLHGRGIVHRDIKPENILLGEDGVAVLCDFGIALAPERRTTLVGDRMGTPSFMPPEQYMDAASVTASADLFGLGVTLYVCWTGQPGMLLLIEHLRARSLAAVPPGLREVIDRATRTDPKQRYASAWDMALDLADVTCG